MLLLLPVAYLLSAGRWWALAIPLVTAWPLLGVTPPVVYPIVFWVTLIATLLVGRAARRSTTDGASTAVGRTDARMTSIDPATASTSWSVSPSSRSRR